MEFQSTEMAVQMRPPQMEATAIPEEQATNNYLENSTLDAENTGINDEMHLRPSSDKQQDFAFSEAPSGAPGLPETFPSPSPAEESDVRVKEECQLPVIKEQSSSRQLSCRHCPSVFRHAASLKRHELAHSNMYPCSCRICFKTFSSVYVLRKHERIHSGHRPFECNVCSKTFVQSGALRVHMRMHTNERPYMCRFCNKSFKQSSALRVHERIHTGERPYICTICSKTFSDSSYFRRHERTHHRKSEHVKCNVCQQSFENGDQLLAHVCVITG